MDDVPSYVPRTVEEIFTDFKARRAAIIKALTTDVKEFFQQCDPDKENQCLYGHPDGQWQVCEPAEEVPAELPEPALGINFARDGLEENEWLALVAVHSDVWLLGVAFFIGARFGLGRADRKRLFNLIHQLPTVFEVVKAEIKKQSKAPSNSSDNKLKSNSEGNQSNVSQLEYDGDDDDEEQEEEEEEQEQEEEEEYEYELEEEEDEDDESETVCGACGEIYSPEEFWICCDACEKWYHGNCVKITPARAEHIKQYKCPICSQKRGRA